MRSAPVAFASAQAALRLGEIGGNGADRRIELGKRNDESVGHGGAS